MQPSCPSFIFLPGLTGGGRSIVALRQLPGLFVPSSISTKEAFKKGAPNLLEHYANLVQEIIDRTGDRDLVLFGHSLGGLETLDLLDTLLKTPNLKSKNISVVFLGVPGFTANGIEGLLECGIRFKNVQLNVSLNEQHVAYPLPDKYYDEKGVRRNGLPNDVVTVSQDTAEDRRKRRDAFRGWFKDSALPKGKKWTKDVFFQKLDQLDKEITGEILTEKLKDVLLAERALLLHSAIISLFKGNNIDDKTHQSFLEMYKERVQDLTNSIKPQLSAMLYLARAGKELTQGVQVRLKEILKKAKETGRKVDVSFVLMERDEMIRPKDISRIKKTLTNANIDQTAISFAFMEQVAHSSIGYEPKALQDYIDILKQRSEER